MAKFDFNIVASIYDEYYNSEIGRQVDLSEKRKLKEFLHQINDTELLEVGCGTGHWTQFFSDLGYRVNGIDISEKMLEKAKEKEIANATFSYADIQNLPFDDHSVNNIIAITSLEFVNNQDKAFDEIRRVLKTGGKFLIGCLNLNSPLGKSKSEVEMFSTAQFFTSESLNKKLSQIGDPMIDACCIMNEEGVSDINKDVGSLDSRLENGCLLIGMVTKK